MSEHHDEQAAFVRNFFTRPDDDGTPAITDTEPTDAQRARSIFTDPRSNN